MTSSGILAGTAVFGLFGYISDGIYLRYTGSARNIVNYSSYNYKKYYLEGTCFVDVKEGVPPDLFNTCNDKLDSPSLIVVGDSHAAALAAGYRAQNARVAQYTLAACPPLFYPIDTRYLNCRSAWNSIMEKLSVVPHGRLVIHANWIQYAGTNFADEMAYTIKYVKSKNPRLEIIILGSVPHWHPNLPARLIYAGADLSTNLTMRMAKSYKLREIDALLQQLSVETNTQFVSAMDAFCELDSCRATVSQADHVALTAWDDAHLTVEGALFLIRSSARLRTL